MQSYYISQSNSYTFRTEPTASTLNEFTMSLTDMTTLQTFTASMTDITYEGYESYIGFTASISGAIVASEYRAVLYNGTPSGSADIWRGTVQVYQSQSIDKSVYENQIPPITSHVSENKYIIMN
jgi:hypothetical protein